MKMLAIWLVAAMVVSCGNGHQMPVRLQGDPVSIAWLAGAWNGEYWGGITGRRGTLHFDLASGSDTLSGDVMMVDPMGNTIRPADAADVHRRHVQSAQRLRIDFVTARADTVRGMLEPYLLPECDCVATTTFEGAVRGDVISGTFETTGRGGLRSRGSWEMRRVGTTRP